MGTYSIFGLMGLALGPLVGGALVDTLGFQPAMFIWAGLGFLGLLVASFVLHQQPPQQHHPFPQEISVPVNPRFAQMLLQCYT